MAHPRILQQQLLDLIRTTFDAGRELPSDEAISERFNLSGIEAARSLYADLADRGAITIKGFGPSRVITLGRNTVAPRPAPRPTPAVVKRTAGARDGSIDAGLAKISEILARGRAAVAPETMREAPAKPIPVSPAVARSTGPDVAGEGAQQGLSPARVAAPHPIVDTVLEPEIVAEIERRADPAPAIAKRNGAASRPEAAAAAKQERNAAMRAARRQLNMNFRPEDFARIEFRATAAGLMPGTYAREQLLALLDGTPLATTTRTIIPASLAAAAIRDGFPVVDFAQRMMALGLAAYSHEMVMA